MSATTNVPYVSAARCRATPWPTVPATRLDIEPPVGDSREVTKDEQRELADRRFEAAIAESGARDPREYYRDRLRLLREADSAAFREAVHYYESRLIPTVAEEDSDPLGEWLEYGRMLAALSTPGETIQVDPSGRAGPYTRPIPGDHLVLHLPTSSREPVVPVGLPPELSPAQRATYTLLVERRTG